MAKKKANRTSPRVPVKVELTTTEKDAAGNVVKKKVEFTATKRATQQPAKCADYPIGAKITRETSKGTTITLERVAPTGKKGNLCWKAAGSKAKKEGEKKEAGMPFP